MRMESTSSMTQKLKSRRTSSSLDCRGGVKKGGKSSPQGLRGRYLGEVVAQVVEPKLRVGDVRHVAADGVGRRVRATGVEGAALECSTTERQRDRGRMDMGRAGNGDEGHSRCGWVGGRGRQAGGME